MGWPKKIVIISLLFLSACLAWSYLLLKEDGAKTSEVILGGQTIRAEVVRNPLAQYRGLSGRKDLCADCGMLFVFTDSDIRHFVMRDMLVPIDIIFIAKGRVIGIAPELLPEGHQPKNIYTSPAPADLVLELPSGYMRSHSLATGTSFAWK